jgi:hypothetical protein
MATNDKAWPTQARRPRTEPSPARRLRETWLSRSRQIEAVRAALARARAEHGGHKPSR